MKEIVVAGGGIGGLSAALALARKGLRVRVLEKAPEFGEIGYGIQMGPNVAKMLDRLGILGPIEAHAFFPDALIFADAVDNREISRIAVGKFFRQRYGYRYFVIHRRDLHGEILNACRARGDIALETSRGLASFEQRGDTVLVRCEDDEEYEGAALVGADGLRSVARQAVIGDGAPRMASHPLPGRRHAALSCAQRDVLLPKSQLLGCQGSRASYTEVPMTRMRRMGVAMVVAGLIAGGPGTAEAKRPGGGGSNAAICAYLKRVIDYPNTNPIIRAYALSLWTAYGCK